MNTITHFFIIALCSYLLGSFNFAIIVSKFVLGVDIRDYGSGNAGATNALRTMGGKKTLLVLAGDILKGVVAVLIGLYLMGPLGKLIAGIFVILGHVFPLYFKFKGGKGVLTGATMLVLFDWRVFLIAFGIFVLAVSITRFVSLGSILGAISFPISTYFFYPDPVFTYIAIGLGSAVVFMHRKNIVKIWKGTESKLNLKNKGELKK